jgi:hypothetical protein
VIDPKGVVFVDEEPITIDWKYNFTFKALAEGEHSLIFKNGYEAGRYVDLSYDIETETFPTFLNQDNALLWIIIIALVIGLISMGLGIAFLLRRKNK